jgi:hypothetical protein
LLEHGWN